VPLLVTTDGAPGPIRAVKEVFPNSLRQRCLAHKTRNITAKVPEKVREAIKAAVQGAYYAPNQQIAEMVAADVLEKYQDEYPSAMAAFQDDWEVTVHSLGEVSKLRAGGLAHAYQGAPAQDRAGGI
jgi:transposase-like protein